MKRFGMPEMLSYILIVGAGIRPGCRSSAKHGVLYRQSHVWRANSARINYLAEFAFRNAFRQQQLKCLAPIRQHGFAIHLEGDRRTCACGYSAGAGRSICVQTALHGAYETIRHGRDDFIAPHRGSRHWSGSRSSAKHGGFAQQVQHGARTATGTPPVAVRGGRQGRG